MTKITRFNWEGSSISFEFKDGNKMINATEMAKPFGKLVADFLRLKGTKGYISILEERYGNLHIATKEVIRVVKGGDANEGIQGTWMDEKLALKFAAWLSPAFELWVYDRIEELLSEGKTSIQHHQVGGIIKGLRAIVDQLEEQEEINIEMRMNIERTNDRLDELESKITSVDENYYTIAGYCNLHKIPCPLHLAKKWGKEAMARSRQEAYPTGTAYDPRYGQVRTYHLSILKLTIKG